MIPQILAYQDMMVFTCEHFLYDQEPILWVFHNEDDQWIFLCGLEHEGGEALLVKFKLINNADSSILQLMELPLGQQAHRASFRDEWVIS